MQECPAGGELLDVSQAAARLHVSRSYLYQLVDRREISHVRLGRRLLFHEDQLQAYVDAHTVSAAPGSEAAQYPTSPASAAGAPGRPRLAAVRTARG